LFRRGPRFPSVRRSFFFLHNAKKTRRFKPRMKVKPIAQPRQFKLFNAGDAVEPPENLRLYSALERFKFSSKTPA
jgi:hypothetical protein